MSVPGRKKSIVGVNSGVAHIDIPQSNNQLLNKSASSTTSLYQQCSALRKDLVRIHGFAPYLSIALSSSSSGSRQSQSTDPVRQLWDCFILGTPLCFLYDLLPTVMPLNVDTDPDHIDPENVKEKKRATAKFIMGLTSLKNEGEWDGGIFTITELHSETRDTNGFVKVVATVSHLVNLLPEDVFMPETTPPSPPTTHSTRADLSGSGIGAATPTGEQSQEIERGKVLRELIETERKYVTDLEIMLNYATALGANNVIDQDTIHHLFPNLGKLLDFQRQFLIVLEGIYEQPWHQQHWGNAFLTKEEEFQVYEPYCANYTSASELLLVEEQNLMALSSMVHPKFELPALLIKPVQRICKYPLLLESLLKRCDDDYPYKDELQAGYQSAQRIATQINEAQRRAENLETVKSLEQRVEDWKGHHLSNFGDLLLDEIFFVTKSDVDREYHVFLFEKIILCCKEVPMPDRTSGTVSRKNTKSAILKKNSVVPPPPPGVPGRKRTTPLLLKGRIFLNNVTSATPSKKDGHSLQVWWRGDDELEYFTLKCRTEEQLKQWESAITKLIKDGLARRASERQIAYNHDRGYSYQSHTPSGSISAPANGRSRFQSGPTTQPEYPMPVPNGYAQSLPYGQTLGLANRQGSGDDTDNESWLTDERGYESPYGSMAGSTGRATPNGMRRPAPLERMGSSSGYSQMSMSMPMPMNGRAPLSRNMSATSDASFGTGAPVPATSGPYGNHQFPKAPGLRSQFSSTKLRQGYEAGATTASPYAANPMSAAQQQQQQQQHLRMRSASSPTAYNGAPSKNGVPPIPIAGSHDTWSTASTVSKLSVTTASTAMTSVASTIGEKRGSGSSQSTNDSSDYSMSQNTSPITPYGSNDSSLATQVRGKAMFAGQNPYGEQQAGFAPPVKVKVHYGDDLFAIVVSRTIGYQELMEKVQKKIRLCGGTYPGQAFRVRYRDEDGDLVSLASNDDLQIALESPHVTLFVA